MKTAVATIALSALALAASAERCNYATIAPQLHSLGPEISACGVTSGYNMIAPTAMPTPEQQWAICATCSAFVDKVTPMTWPNCTLPLAGSDQTLTDYFNAVAGPCLL